MHQITKYIIMEKYNNSKKYPAYNNFKELGISDTNKQSGEEFYRGFTYSEFASIFRCKVLEGGQKSQKMQPFIDEFNSAEYYKILKDLIRLGVEKVDLDRLVHDIEKIKISAVRRLKEKLDDEYKRELEKLKRLGLKEEEEGD